jgi:hypothetical protein
MHQYTRHQQIIVGRKNNSDFFTIFSIDMLFTKQIDTLFTVNVIITTELYNKLCFSLGTKIKKK